MSEPTYQIVFRGKILSGFSREDVRPRLAALFRADERRIDALLDAPKTVLKTGLTKDAAARYQEALRQAGIMVAAIAEGGVQSVAPLPAATPVRAPDPAPQVTEPDGLSLAPVGERLLPAVKRARLEIDTSALSLAEPGAILGQRHDAPTLALSLDHLALATDEGPIDASPRSPARAIDTSALELVERPLEPEKGLTELQKLLASDPGA